MVHSILPNVMLVSTFRHPGTRAVSQFANEQSHTSGHITNYSDCRTFFDDHTAIGSELHSCYKLRPPTPTPGAVGAGGAALQDWLKRFGVFAACIGELADVNPFAAGHYGAMYVSV